MKDMTGPGTSVANSVPLQPQLERSNSCRAPAPYRQSSGDRVDVRQSVDYDEELALALAISVSEVKEDALRRVQERNERKKEDQDLRRRQEQEDRDFAYALQLQSEQETGRLPLRPVSQEASELPSSLGLPSPFHSSGTDPATKDRKDRKTEPGPLTTSSPDELLDAHRCAGCDKWLGIKTWTTALGKRWHPNCFRCAACHKNLNGEFTPEGGDPYHPECHRALFHECCKVCGEHLPKVGNKISWSEHPFWQQKYCGKHNLDGTSRCTACERLKGQGDSWVRLQDGRELCSFCVGSIIVDTQDCQPLYKEILQTYAELGLPIPSEPPLMLVDQQALNDCDAHEGHHKGAPQSQTRGMTLAESEYRSIRTVKKSSGWAVFPEIVRVERRQCSVTAILVLYGLPRLLTGSILAHEVMHAWLKLKSVMRLSQEVEEGLCQLMALIWLERQLQKCKQDPYEKLIGNFIAHQIRTNPTTVYGDGFRAAHASFERFGLKTVIEHVSQTGQLPVHERGV